MNPPVIISTGHVSTTIRKRDAERSVNWTAEETQVLLCVWSDERVQKSLAENIRNTHIFKHLSARMSEMGFSRSPHQCRMRVKTLKANYVRAKLQQSADSSQPCTFKYFAEMDAVLGRRSGRVEKGLPFICLDRCDGGYISQDQDYQSRVDGDHLNSKERQTLSFLEQQVAGPLYGQVKLEHTEDSSNEFEFVDERNPQSEVNREITTRSESNGTTGKSSFSSSPSHAIPLTAPDPAPLPFTSHHSGSPDESSNTDQPHPDSSFLEPALKHLSVCFQQLVSETKSLLVQLEGQRHEHARWHQELMAQWLQREECRQKEMAEREERREKARMEHEIRVLELLHNITTQHICPCRSDKRQSDTFTRLNCKNDAN